MGILIEDQIHQFFIKKEEDQCRALEKKSGKKIKRNKIKKPWTRAPKSSLCQDLDLLIIVDQYDYDLGNVDFKKYCRARSVLHVAGEEGSKRWEYF